MLIEGAIRFGRQAEDLLRRGERVAAAMPLLRTIDIVGELLAAVRANKSDLNKKMAEQYWFLLRRVSEAKINSDMAPLSEALRLLDYERQTWQMLCDKLSADNQTGSAAPQPKSLSAGRNGSAAKSGFSFEA
jgi:flagellar protein FliS